MPSPKTTHTYKHFLIWCHDRQGNFAIWKIKNIFWSYSTIVLIRFRHKPNLFRERQWFGLNKSLVKARRDLHHHGYNTKCLVTFREQPMVKRNPRLSVGNGSPVLKSNPNLPFCKLGSITTSPDVFLCFGWPRVIITTASSLCYNIHFFNTRYTSQKSLASDCMHFSLWMKTEEKQLLLRNAKPQTD